MIKIRMGESIMNILWLNWCDITNPHSGGAEVYIHEVTKRLIKKDCNVTLFAVKYPGSKKYDELDGVGIVRNGNKYTIY